jgi:pyrroline-5-carboxylate reductase
MSKENPQTMPEAPYVTILGGGVMGGTIVTALRVAGWSQDRIKVVEKDSVRASALREGHGIEVTDSVVKAVTDADIVVIAVKPHDTVAVLEEVKPAFKNGALLFTVVAGLPTSFYENLLPDGTPVVRAMPNTPSIVARGATAIAAGKNAKDTHIALSTAMLRATGLVVTVSEDQMDAVTAVSGSGPAYFYAMVEALTEAGVAQGLDRVLATQLAAQTFVGAAHLLMESGDTPQTLRKRVSSPGGTTIAALEAMEHAGLQGVISAAANAAAARSKELAAELGGS